ncbi:hypothetical protein Hte_011674 [Hypoxylon texense]
MSTTTGAGFETTAAAIRIAAFHIYSDPRILRRLRVELAAAPDHDWKTLEQLPYLTATIMEAMRLATAIAARSARVAQDKDLNEQEDPEPKRFNPDRFMDPDPWQLGDETFVPFGKGKRDCVGTHLAWAEIYLLLGNLVQRFEFEFPTTAAEDFYVTMDNFALGTPSTGVVPALVTQVTI